MIYSNTKKKSKSKEAGTATVEVALLLPLYVFLILSLLFIGSFHLLNLRMLKAVAYLSQKPGSQTVTALPSEITQLPTANFANSLEDLTLSDAIESQLFASEDLLAMYNEATYNVTGHYSMQGDQIVYSTSVSITGIGALNEKYKLSDIRDDLSGELDQYCERTATSLSIKMRLPFSSSSTSGNGSSQSNATTSIDFNSDLWGNIVHEHHDVIRKGPNDDGTNLFRRLNFLDSGVQGDRTKAVDRLLGQTWTPASVSNSFIQFWQSNYIPPEAP